MPSLPVKTDPWVWAEHWHDFKSFLGDLDVGLGTTVDPPSGVIAGPAAPGSWSVMQNSALTPNLLNGSAFKQNPRVAPGHSAVCEALSLKMAPSTSESRSSGKGSAKLPMGMRGSEVLGPGLSLAGRLAGTTVSLLVGMPGLQPAGSELRSAYFSWGGGWTAGSIHWEELDPKEAFGQLCPRRPSCTAHALEVLTRAASS